jgi:hypothetical protein
MYQTMIVEAREVVAGVVDGASKGVVHSQSDIIIWIYAAAINVLILILWWVVKRWVNNIDTWRGDAAKGGGFMTRDQYFEWCKPQQAKCREGLECRVDDVEQWRDTIMEKGGPLPKLEHDDLCEKRTNKIWQQVEASLNHQRELIAGELKLIQVTLQKDVIEEIRDLKKELNHRNGSK